MLGIAFLSSINARFNLCFYVDISFYFETVKTYVAIMVFGHLMYLCEELKSEV